MMSESETTPRGELVLYQTEDGKTRVQVRLTGETVWLTQKLMAELFQKDVRTISEHIHSIFAEGELQPGAVVRNFRTTAAEGKTYDTQHYNLTMYLDLAELQALNRRPMYMRDWIAKLDEFLRLNERDILTHAGAISHEQALDKARTEYEKFHAQQALLPSPVEGHFQEAVVQARQLQASGKRPRRKGKRTT